MAPPCRFLTNFMVIALARAANIDERSWVRTGRAKSTMNATTASGGRNSENIPPTNAAENMTKMAAMKSLKVGRIRIIEDDETDCCPKCSWVILRIQTHVTTAKRACSNTPDSNMSKAGRKICPRAKIVPDSPTGASCHSPIFVNT